MARLIDADALDSVLEDFERRYKKSWFVITAKAISHVRQIVYAMKDVDAVSRGVHDQVCWERDVAIEQLESYGVSLGEKAEVAKVVHGRWVKLGKHDWACSVCKRGVPYSFTGHHYCHNCGSHNVAWNIPKADEIDFDYEAEDGR